MEIMSIKQESIISTTIDLINENGIQAVSTREVAKRLGISQGSVFQYFPKKSDLLAAVLEHFSQYDRDIFNTGKLKNLEPREAILFFIDTCLLYYENYPAITAVTQAFDILRNDPELGGRVKEIYDSRTRFIRERISEARETGTLKKDCDEEVLADILVSTWGGICLKWRISNFAFSLREHALKAISQIFDLLQPR
jgi:AcrR family transcriptional regulator